MVSFLSHTISHHQHRNKKQKQPRLSALSRTPSTKMMLLQPPTSPHPHLLLPPPMHVPKFRLSTTDHLNYNETRKINHCCSKFWCASTICHHHTRSRSKQRYSTSGVVISDVPVLATSSVLKVSLKFGGKVGEARHIPHLSGASWEENISAEEFESETK